MRKLKKATETATETTATTAPATGPISFTAPGKDLARALKRVVGFTDRKSTMPMLSQVCVRATATEVTIAATDLSHAAVHTAPAWHVHATGSICVNAKQLGDVLKRIPDGDVTMRSHGDRVEITVGANFSVTLEAMHARDFPKIPAILPDDKVLSLATADAAQICTMIDQATPAICRDESRFHMNGVLLAADAGSARMVATDGHRLVKVETLGALGAFKLDKAMIIPAKPLAEVRRLVGKGTCEIGTLDKATHLLIRHGGTTMAIKPIDAEFPSYTQVVPTENRRLVSVDRLALVAAVKRASVVCTDTRGVKLACVPEGLKLSADHPDLGSASEIVAAEMNPETHFAIGVNARYLLDALNGVADERVTLAFRDELDPILVRSTKDAAYHRPLDASFLCVIMPMRL